MRLMLNVGGARKRKALALKPAHAELHPILRKRVVSKGPDMSHETIQSEHTVRNGRLELSITRKYNRGVHQV